MDIPNLLEAISSSIPEALSSSIPEAIPTYTSPDLYDFSDDFTDIYSIWDDLIILIPLIIFTYFLLRVLYFAHFTPLSYVPDAHWSAPYSRIWLIWLKFQGKEHRTRYELHQKLGDVIRLAPKELSVNCIEHGVGTVYDGKGKGRVGEYWDKGNWYAGLRNFGYKYLFSIVSEEDHKERKGMISHSFSLNSKFDSPELEEILNTVLFQRFLPQVGKWQFADKTVNMLRETKAYCMDVTSAFTFGLKTGTTFVENEERKELFGAFEAINRGTFWRSEFPLTARILGIFGIRFMSSKHVRELLDFENNVVWECRAAADTPGIKTVYADFRPSIVANPGLRDEDIDGIIQAEMWDILQAGHEGPGITLAYLMSELYSNPLALGKLVWELRRIASRGKESLPSVQDISDAPYLDAVIMETMRLYPSALGPFPRVVPPNLEFQGADGSIHELGTRIGNFQNIPPGTTVSASAFSLHRNPEIFPSPEEWIPERWLDEENEIIPEILLNPAAPKVPRSEMLKWWWGFGSGTRACLGNHEM